MKNAFSEFNKYIQNQIEYGSKKYSLNTQKEATDDIFDNHSHHWFFGNIDGYVYRLKNLNRERDYLKIGAYSFIGWLKRGFHLQSAGTISSISTTIDVKTKYFPDFVISAFTYYENNEFYLTTLLPKDALQKISNILKDLSRGEWEEVTEEKLIHIYCLAFTVWNELFFETGKAGKDLDTFNEFRGVKEKLLEVALAYFKDTEYDEQDVYLLVEHQFQSIQKLARTT